MKKIISGFCLFLAIFSSSVLSAHDLNASYIFLRIYETEGIDGHFELNINEVNRIFNLNLSKDVTVDEIAPHLDRIQNYLLQHSSFSSRLGKHPITFKEVDFRRIPLGSFLKLYFHLENTNLLPEALDVKYDAVFDMDSSHRGFLVVDFNWRAGIIENEAIVSLYFTPDNPQDTLDLNNLSAWKGFMAMLRQGVWHIWIGFDHILFLIALILPSVLKRRKDDELKPTRKNFFGWEPVMKFKPAFFYILKIITFFTIAHTITLTLATLQIVNIPARLVETLIAFSIGLAAFHNIKPIFKGKDWIIAFVFGLFHGFGFASVLGDLGLTNEFLTLSLLGFNVGVEVGQIIIIALIFPILFLLRRKRVYRGIFFYGCIFLIIASLYWITERIFDLDFGVEGQIKSWLYQLFVLLGLR